MTASPDYFPNTRQKFSNLVDVLRYRALHQPDKTAYTFCQDREIDISLNYQNLDRSSRAIAAQLQYLGYQGERALLLYPPGLEFMAAFFGCLYASVVAVPSYPLSNRSMSRLQAIVASSQAKVALTTSSQLGNMDWLEQHPELAQLRWLATDTIASSLVSDWQEPEVNSDTLAFLQYTSGSTGMPKGVMVSHGNLLHNCAAIHKCFKDTPNSLVVSWLPPHHDMGLIGGVLQPLYVGMPMVMLSPREFLQKPWRWLWAISHYRATTSGGPNFAYDLCVEKIKPEQRASLDLSSWDLAFNGAEPIHSSTLERFATTFAPWGFAKKAFYPCYGMAETTLIVSGGLRTQPPVVRQLDEVALSQNRVVAAEVKQESFKEIVGCGQTWLGQKIAIADPKSLTQCPSEQVGEIWIHGPSVAQGYWNRPIDTKQTFQAYLADTGEGPFIRTGDLGFLQDGELFVTGRLKDLIIIRGRNHYPQDIEVTVQKSHPALHSSAGAAFTVEVEGVERLIIAQEVGRSYLRTLDGNEVIKAIRQAVSHQHELQVYGVVLLKSASIPKTSSGKIQRHACRDGFLNGSLDVVSEWTANAHQPDLLQLQIDVESLLELQKSGRKKAYSDKNNHSEVSFQQKSLFATPIQEVIKDCLVSHLAIHLKIHPSEIDINESFASYGVDSSLAVSLTGELGNWLECELEPTLFWEYPSIEALANYLAAISHG